MRLRKLRRAAQPAIGHVDGARDAVRDAIELGKADNDLAFRPRTLGEARHQGVAIFADAVRLLAKQPRDFIQHVGEGRAAEARLFRKIRAAPHRLAGRLRNIVSGQPPCSPSRCSAFM